MKIKNIIIVLFCLLLIFLPLNSNKAYATVNDSNNINAETINLNINGRPVQVLSYGIDGQSFFMLRDLAYILSFTNKKIDIGWDGSKSAISIVPDKSYSPTGIELSNSMYKYPINAVPSTSDIYYKGNKVDITIYRIHESNYVRLEDLALLLDIGLVYEKDKLIGLDTNMFYDKEKHVFVPSKNVAILLYHTFTEGEPEEEFYDTTVSKDKFENDIKLLLKEGYKSLSLENYYLNKYDKNKKYFILTFDDGYTSNYDIAFDIIKKYNVSVDIFINTDQTYRDNRFKLEQAKEMEDSRLIKIYSHYPLHIDVRDIEASEYTIMLKKSIETLETVLDKKDFYFFAYPYSFYTEEKYKLTKEAGYKLQAVQILYHDCGDDLIVRYNISYLTDVLEMIKK